jgi:hypothetical protein
MAMTLPATLLEAEAVAFARRRIAFARSGKLKLFGVEPGAWFEKGESQRACRLMLREVILRDVTNLMDAVELARAGYELWEECLRELILEYKNRGKTMPTYLAAFDMELTRGIRHKAGRRRDNDLARDLIIGHTVGMVAERFGLRPTRNYTSRRVSACSIVAAALRLEGLAMSEANVNQIWKAMPAACKNRSWSQWEANINHLWKSMPPAACKNRLGLSGLA